MHANFSCLVMNCPTERPLSHFRCHHVYKPESCYARAIEDVEPIHNYIEGNMVLTLGTLCF